MARTALPIAALLLSASITACAAVGTEPKGVTRVGGAPPVAAPADASGVLAFPGAEGFGARATGGRGGKVITVTTLDTTGPGSLQEALDTPGPRIVVFAVSGVIADASGANVQLTITEGDLTIAGQSAPGAGITIRGQLFTDYSDAPSNIVVRHLRVRPVYDGTDAAQFDAIQFSRAQRFILDHVSVSGGADETVDLYEATDATVQWSAIEFPADVAPEGETEGQVYGLVNGPDGARVSVHHNLFAHNRNRTPAIANGPAEVVNNVVYDMMRGFVHNNPASGPFAFIGNHYKDGPSVDGASFYFDAPEASDFATLSYYLDGNVYEGTGHCTAGPTDDPWATCDLEQETPASNRTTSAPAFTGDLHAPVTATTAQEAWTAVLAGAGAFPRDAVTTQAVTQTMEGTGRWGIPYGTTTDLLAGLTPAATPVDTDADGMPDVWENARGLSPTDPADAASVQVSGYTAIEEHLNELAAALVR
ncbi:hypothetical protein [Pseudonocardia sp.]|uniref:hypothetical protein n=1 Tax=Pseudonocardia sp. TaxID=60912 RepID=UPI003D0DDBF8